MVKISMKYGTSMYNDIIRYKEELQNLNDYHYTTPHNIKLINDLLKLQLKLRDIDTTKATIWLTNKEFDLCIDATDFLDKMGYIVTYPSRLPLV